MAPGRDFTMDSAARRKRGEMSLKTVSLWLCDARDGLTAAFPLPERHDAQNRLQEGGELL